MSEKRRGLGRGLGALIPQETASGVVNSGRPVDVFFPDDGSKKAEGRTGRQTARPQVDVSRETMPRRAANGSRPVSAKPSGSAATKKAAKAAPAKPAAKDPASGARQKAPVEPVPVDLVPVPGATFAELPTASIRPNPKQPRTVFDDEAMRELTHSVREIGVLQPIVVRPLAEADIKDGIAYELIMGERRWRATQAAGLSEVPAIIRATEDDDLLRDALLENLHRSQLNPLEEAAAYQQLLDDFACTHDELAQRIGRSRPQISNTIRLLKLPPLVQRRVSAGVLTAGHARALLGLPDAAAIERLAQRIVAEGLSVRSTEEIVALHDADATKRPVKPRERDDERNSALQSLSGKLSDHFETRVQVMMGKKKGKVTIEFASLEDLDRIMEAMGSPKTKST